MKLNTSAQKDHGQSGVLRGGLSRTTVFHVTLIYAILYALITAVVLGIVYTLTTSQIHARIDMGIKTEANALVTLGQTQGMDTLTDTIAQRGNDRLRDPEASRRAGGFYYLLLDKQNRRVAGALPAWLPKTNRKSPWVDYTIGAYAAVRAGLEKAADFDADDGMTMRGLVKILPGGYRLLVAERVDDARDLSTYILIALAVAVGLILVFGLAGGVWMGRHVVTRLESVRSAAAAIMAGDLSRRIAVAPRRDEFHDLANTLNAMLARIEELMTSLRQVTNNVAHDLRSPLNRLRTRLEVTLLESRRPEEYRAAMEQAVGDADELLQTFNAMLNLAELEAGVSREHEETLALDSLCEDAASIYEPLAEVQGQTLVRCFDPVRLRGNRLLLAQAVGNLLDNAIKYTPEGGRIRLSLSQDAREALLMVEDSGPGIPPGERQHVFERFVRLDRSRSLRGNGLGLSLVRAVVRLHGGNIALEDNRPGLRVLIRLPLQSAGGGVGT
ncbi:MAG: ATP-binding protein [Gammaproteobacteria bacterium]